MNMSYYLILDVGTTAVKAFAYSEDGNIVKRTEKKAPVLFPEPGWVEQDPEKLWNMVYDASMEIIDELGKPLAVGITNQRASTIVWNKDTGEALYNMITWQDTRAADLAKEYSKKFVLKFGRGIGKIVSKIFKKSKSKRINYLITISDFKFGPNQPIIHLRWLLDNDEELLRLAKEDKLAFGTIDSWIVWKLLRIHVTDYTNASATGLFDPFFLKWSDRLTKLLGIPKNILPKLVDNMGNFGKIKLFDDAPLTAIIADQQSSLFSAGGIQPGVIKMTNGTGTFIDINVGSTPFPARYGTYPMVAIKWREHVNYLLEGIVQATGSAIDWLIDVGLISDYSEIPTLLESIAEEELDLVFIPSFAGLGTPYWNSKARGLIYGLTRATRKQHIVKALLDGIAIRCSEVIEILEKATGMKIEEIISDGNASKNDYLLQAIADYSEKIVKRVENLEGTSRGAFLLAKGGLRNLSISAVFERPIIDKVFRPRKRRKNRWKQTLELALMLAK